MLQECRCVELFRDFVQQRVHARQRQLAQLGTVVDLVLKWTCEAQML